MLRGMAEQPPSTGSPLPTAPPAGGTPEPPRDGRALLVALGAVALVIGVLASLPARATSAARPGHRGRTAATTTTTTAPAATSSTTSTTTAPGAGIRVAVLAAAGSPTISSTESKLSTAGYTLVPESSIPYSWVSSLPSPVIHYPSGYHAQALRVASTLGVPSSAVTAEAPGTSYGSDVVEVFLQPT